jgi:hypothetical protein
MRPARVSITPMTAMMSPMIIRDLPSDGIKKDLS